MLKWMPRIFLSALVGGLVGGCDVSDEDALARKGKGVDDGKALVCHGGKELNLPEQAVPAHAAHGDLVCEAPRLEIVDKGGTGCPSGSVGVSLANDALSFTLIFDAFAASTGPGVHVTAGRKDCSVDLLLHLPPGHTDMALSVDYRGYVDLADGWRAEHRATYTLDGEELDFEAGPSSLEPYGPGVSAVHGPVTEGYVLRHTLFESFDHALCDGPIPLRLRTSVQLVREGGNNGDHNQITVDSIDGKEKVLATDPC